MTFIEYIKIKKPICHFRSKQFILRFGLKGDESYETLKTIGCHGHKTRNEILKLINKFNKVRW